MMFRAYAIAFLFLVSACGAAEETGVKPLTANSLSSESSDVSRPATTLSLTQVKAQPAAADTERLAAPIDAAPRQGAVSPTVYIVQYSDFQCPFCARVIPTIKRLVEKYPNDVAVIFRHNPLPFHSNAKSAAYAAMNARQQLGDEGFYQMHDLLFENYRSLGMDAYKKFATQLGMDPVAMESAINNGSYEAEVQSDIDRAQELGAGGTPGHFINGRKLMGAQPFEEFDKIVQEEIALANKEISEGHSRESLYARRMEHALDEAPAPAPRKAPTPVVDTQIYHVPVTDSPTQGQAEALITIVAFTDLQCPYCARAESTLRDLQTKYGDKLRIVFKHNPLPFHLGAMPAHKLLLEAKSQKGDKAFFKLKDKLFETVQEWGERGPASETPEQYQEKVKANLLKIAKTFKLNSRRVKRAFDKTAHAERISADQQLARRVGARGTPAFFINGRKLSGAQPQAAFDAIITEQLARAEALVASGTPAKKVYAALVQDGVKNVDAPKPGATVAIPSDAPSRGPAKPKVTIQIFSDFQCPFCSRVNPTLENIKKAYKGKIRFVWHHLPLPFHKHAKLAAEASIEVQKQAGDAAFWKFHDILFQNQHALEQADLEKYAQQISGVTINASAFKSALDQHTKAARAETCHRNR